jgi:asparagine synthase (glutamine-hydrolysing)
VTANLHLARFARRSGITVAQVGEGGDEVFCGYDTTHRLWRLHDRLGALAALIPRPAAGWLERLGGPALEWLGNPSLVGSLDGTVLEQLRRYARGEHLYWGYGVLWGEQARLLKRPASTADPYRHLSSRMAQVRGFHERPYLDQLTLIDLLLGLPERLLMRVDRACMRYGLEARVPFLDPAVTQLAFRIPQHLRAPQPKAFLKAYARRKLPAEILARPKVGFPTARGVFLSPAVLARIRHDVLDNRFIELAGFERSQLENLFRLERTAESRVFYQIWSVYVLSLWFHHWVEHRP